MRLKAGVSTRVFSTQLQIALQIADQVYAVHGVNMVITSINDGRHSLKSKHWTGDAADLRTHNIPQDIDKQQIAQEIREALGNSRDYDVMLEYIDTPNEHIHIEYDPKGGPDA